MFFLAVIRAVVLRVRIDPRGEPDELRLFQFDVLVPLQQLPHQLARVRPEGIGRLHLGMQHGPVAHMTRAAFAFGRTDPLLQKAHPAPFPSRFSYDALKNSVSVPRRSSPALGVSPP